MGSSGANAGVIGILAESGAPNALAGAITGIGFIGGGLVYREALGSRQVVLGVTTASALFAAAAIGRRWAKHFPDDEQSADSGQPPSEH